MAENRTAIAVKILMRTLYFYEDAYMQHTLQDMVCMLTGSESSCTFLENMWTASDRCGSGR